MYNTDKEVGEKKTETHEDEFDLSDISARRQTDEEIIAAAEAALKEKEAALDAAMMQIPNMAHPDAPIGKEDTENCEVKRVGTVPQFDFEPKDHVQLAEALDLIDFDAATKVSGVKFYYLKNEAVFLEQALVLYGLNILRKHGFTPFITPDVAKEEILRGIGFNPRGSESNVYTIEDEGTCLVATAEITLGGYHADEILEKALNQAREGRMHILGKITDTIAKPNPTVKPHAPKIVKMDMPKEYIGAFIGTGGKNIQDLQARTNTTIVVEEVGELGIIEILGTDEAGIQEAIEAVNAVKFEPVEGETYTVKVVRLVEFGAFVEFVPGKDSLLHISEVSWDRIDKIEDALKEGDIIEVKYLGIDPKTKKTRVSRKALLPRPPREDRPKSDKPYNDKPRNDRNKGHNNHQKPRQE